MRGPFRQERAAAAAVLQFRDAQVHDPLESYLHHFALYCSLVERLIDQTDDLTRLVKRAVGVLTDPERLTVVRYLASSAISEDGLKVLADAVLTPKRLEADSGMAGRGVGTVLLGLDGESFPWVAQGHRAAEWIVVEGWLCCGVRYGCDGGGVRR